MSSAVPEGCTRCTNTLGTPGDIASHSPGPVRRSRCNPGPGQTATTGERKGTTQGVPEGVPEGVPADEPAAAGISVAEVVLAFLRHAKTYYRHPDGTPTGGEKTFRDALRAAVFLLGMRPVESLTGRDLRAVRQLMIGGYTHPQYGEQRALTRSVINSRIGKIVQVMKWAVSQELVSATVWTALRAVECLKPNRSEARETEEVVPVPEEHVLATLPYIQNS